MVWKKVNLFDHLNCEVFMDEYGYCRPRCNGLLINGSSTNELFILNEESGVYEQIIFDNSNAIKDTIKRLFNSKFAKPKKSTSNGYYGYRQLTLNQQDAVPVKIHSVTIDLKTEYYISSGLNGNAPQLQTAHDSIEIESADDLKKYYCWYQEHSSFHDFAPAILSEIEVGDELYLVGVGKVKTTKLLDFPNKNNDIIEVIDSDNKKIVARISAELFYLPYKKVFDEYDVLNKSLNELKLSPYVLRQKDCDIYNIYWDKIEEASSYIVSLYKKLPSLNKRSILHLADYQIDRNTHYLALDKLIGSDFIFKVKAENRNGEIIAESRGIVSGLPRFFDK